MLSMPSIKSVFVRVGPCSAEDAAEPLPFLNPEP